jgi:nucleotide-binding universal stress UspA family protein
VQVLTDIRGAMADMPVQARRELVAGDIDKFERGLQRKSDERLERIAARHRKEPVRMRTETLLGVPFVEVIHAVLKEKYDLVIAGTRGLSRLKRIVVGSTAERLTRQCPCPVWIVKPGFEGSMRSVLVAIDFSDVSRKAIQLGASLAALAGARLDVMHAMFIPAENAIDALQLTNESTADTKMDEYRHTLRQESSLRLFELVSSYVPRGLDARVRLEHGEPWKMIGKTARCLDSDLVVMGTVSRAGIPGFLIGNTAEKVLRTCDRSILTVKPEGFVSPVQAPDWSLHPESADDPSVCESATAPCAVQPG